MDYNKIELNSIIDWRRRCDDEAQEMVCRLKNKQVCYCFIRIIIYDNSNMLYIYIYMISDCLLFYLFLELRNIMDLAIISV